MSLPQLREASHLPHSEESEQAVLSGALLEGSLFSLFSARLSIEDFYSQRNRTVYEAMLQVEASGAAIDLRTVQAALEQKGKFDSVGGVAYLASLDLALPYLGGLKTYVEIVKERSVRRRLIDACGDITRDCLDGGLVAQEAVRRGEELIGALAREIGSSGPEALGIEEFLRLEIPAREFLVDGLLRRQDLCMIHSWRGRGKTYLGVTLACGLACGENVLKWAVSKPMGVLYVDGEMPAIALQARFAATLAGMDADPLADLRILCADLEERGIPNLTTPAGQAAVEAQLEGVGVVLLDNLSTLMDGGPENDAESWSLAQEWLLKLRRMGLAVVLFHHSGKSGQQRGTSRREDVLDVVLSLRAPSDYRPEDGCRFEVHFEKSRGLTGAAVEPLEAKLITDKRGRITWSVRDLKGVTAERVQELSGLGLSQRAIAAELSVNQSTVSRNLKKSREGDR